MPEAEANDNNTTAPAANNNNNNGAAAVCDGAPPAVEEEDAWTKLHRQMAERLAPAGVGVDDSCSRFPHPLGQGGKAYNQ